jgi:glycosyltransferase involved in cell wall biosynthesis
MRIVSVMTTSADGGAEFAAVEMLDALRERGWETVMLTNRPGIGRDTRVAVKPIEIGPKLARRTWSGLVLRWPLLQRRLRRALEREAPYDVLLVHYKKEQIMAAFLPARLRARLVWAEWGPVPYPLRRGPARRLYVWAASRAAAIMCVSEGTKQSVEETGVPPGKAVVVPNVVRARELVFNPEGRARVRESLGIPADAFVVGCVSRFHPKKRNDVVVDAVVALDSDAHLVLAGSGETEDELRSRAEPLGWRAHFVPTPGAEVADVYSAFDVSVFCPSPTEGAPRAVILAMLMERACVSTGAEGVTGLLGDGVGTILSPENDPAALAAVLRAYRDSPGAARAEGEAARRRAEAEYDAPVVAERIERLLSSL